jgi:hypothetical protein
MPYESFVKESWEDLIYEKEVRKGIDRPKAGGGKGQVPAESSVYGESNSFKGKPDRYKE